MKFQKQIRITVHTLKFFSAPRKFLGKFSRIFEKEFRKKINNGNQILKKSNDLLLIYELKNEKQKHIYEKI